MLAIIEIPWIHKDKAQTSYAGALYAALDVIGSGNPELAQKIHDANGPSLFSANLHRGVLRLGLLSSELFLSVANCRLSHKARRKAATSFDCLLDGAATSQHIKLKFVSPTAVNHNGVNTDFPITRHVFGSLINRWRAAGGPIVPDLKYDEVHTIGAIIKIVRADIGNYAQKGWVGSISYRVPEDVAKWYHALANFGEYSGVGCKTSQGLGQVRYEGN